MFSFISSGDFAENEIIDYNVTSYKYIHEPKQKTEKEGNGNAAAKKKWEEFNENQKPLGNSVLCCIYKQAKGHIGKLGERNE